MYAPRPSYTLHHSADCFQLTSYFLRALNAPENASLHTLQYMGRACDVEYQRWFPERKSWWSPAWKERDGNTAAIQDTMTVNKSAELCWSTCTEYTVMPQAVKWPAMDSKRVGTSVLTNTGLRSSQISFSYYWQLFHSITHSIHSCSSLKHGCVKST